MWEGCSWPTKTILSSSVHAVERMYLYRNVLLAQREMSNRLQRLSRHFSITLKLIGQQSDHCVVSLGVSIFINVDPVTLNTCSGGSSSSFSWQSSTTSVASCHINCARTIIKAAILFRLLLFSIELVTEFRDKSALSRCITGGATAYIKITHSHGMRECCKGDDASQWENGNSTHRHAQTP